MIINIDKKMVVLGCILAVVLAALGITAILTKDKRETGETTTTKNKYSETSYTVKTVTSESETVTETTEGVTSEVTVPTSEEVVTKATKTVPVTITNNTTLKKVETIYIDGNKTYSDIILSDSDSNYPEEIILLPKEGSFIRKVPITSSTTRPKSTVCAPSDNGYHCYLTGLASGAGASLQYGTSDSNVKTIEIIRYNP